MIFGLPFGVTTPKMNNLRTLRFKLQTLKTYAATAQVNWQGPSTDEVIKVAQLQSGSAGVDGWKGEELKHLNSRYLAHVSQLGIVLGSPRLAIFGSPMCPDSQGFMHPCLKVDRVRPITVMSAWWRLWSSCLVKCASTRSWIEQAIPNEVIAGTGPTAAAQMAAATIYTAISKDNYGCAFDFSKCYDTLSPKGTEALLVAGNFPAHWITTLRLVWNQQHRKIFWGMHCHSAPLKHTR